MKSIAIIGSGISGLSAAYYLKDVCDVHVFEKDARSGGHANSVPVDEGHGSTGIDTAFMVFNRNNYIGLSRLFDDLGVRTKSHEGGYNFFDLDSGVQFGTPEMEMTRDQIVSAYPPAFVSIWEQADRFYRESPRHFLEGKAFVSLKDYFRANGYTEDFIRSFVVQLCSACWSLPPELIGEMPASTLIGFFMNHGNSGLGGKRVSWETVEGGSSEYVEKLVATLPNGVNHNAFVSDVHEVDGRVHVRVNGESRNFDYVLLALHADQSHAALTRPTGLQARMLGGMRYNRCVAKLHTDTSILPVDRSRWESWNYGVSAGNGANPCYLVYHMNKIQGLDLKQDYLVSIDCTLPVREDKLIAQFEYEHPVVDMHAYQIQDRIHELNDEGAIFFSGTYFSIRKAGPDFAGFHESGIQSALEVVRRVMDRVT